jgi:predicted enzyme related to lactoylglutathione lyase
METIRPGAVIFAKDVAALARFYETVIPMAVKGEEHGAVVLETDMLQLVIHPLPDAVAREIMIGSPPALREETAVKLVFAVDSLARVRMAATALGGGLRPVSAAFVTRGFRACDGHDPEGNVIQLREPAR